MLSRLLWVFVLLKDIEESFGGMYKAQWMVQGQGEDDPWIKGM